jgi:DNA-binding NarL/FixJ family response regulator
MIKLLLIDDQAQVRQGLQMRLHLEPDMTVVGEADNGVMALNLIRELQPDVALLDLEMPGLDGLAMLTILSKIGWPCAVVILSLHDDEATRRRTLSAGAAAFVSKQAGDAPLLAAIRRAVAK